MREMMAAKKKMKVLSCLVVITILMSGVSVSAVVQDVSNGIAEGKNFEEASAAKEFKSQAYSNSLTIKSISNNKIADIAVSYEGQNLGNPWGQCKAFVQKVVRQAGGSLDKGYQKCYLTVGRVIQSNEATRGDIIQLNKASDPEAYYTGMHTAIVLENYGDNNFKVVDSNWKFDTTVRIHDWNPYNMASKHGLQVHFYRLGEISSTPSADLNCDGRVGPADFAILLSWWRRNPSEAKSCKSPDIDGDGNVNAGDMGIMLSQWSS
jgi:hypothetical protein